MKHILIATFLAVCVLIPSRTVMAQSDGTVADRKAMQQTRRDELVRKIEHLKYEKMTSALGLDPQDASKFFDFYKPAEKDIQGLVRQRNDELKKLALLMNGAKGDAAAEQEIAKIQGLNQQIEGREQLLDNDLKGILSPSQRARLLVFEHEFNQRVRQEVAKHQLARGGEARALRQQLRQERVRNRLLRKLAQGKATEHK